VGVIADHVGASTPGWAVAIFGSLGPQALGLKAAYFFTSLWPILLVPVILALRENPEKPQASL
jgi:hypothetical protein